MILWKHAQLNDRGQQIIQNARTDLFRLSTYFSTPEHDSRPAFWSAQSLPSADSPREIDSAIYFGLANTLPMGTPNIGAKPDRRRQKGCKGDNETCRPSTNTFSTSSDQTSPSPDLSNLRCFRWGVSVLLDTSVVIFILS